MTRKRWSNTEVSAYLDGALTPRNQAALEADIAQDRDLRRRVEELRTVSAMVQAVPLRQPPRNYLLTPSMVADPKPEPTQRRRPLWAMRLATSLVAAAFVISFGLTLLQQGMRPSAATLSREAAPGALMQQSEPATDDAMREMEDARAIAPAEAPAQSEEVPAEPEEAPEAAMMLQSTPLSPEEEMDVAPMPESGESTELPDEGEGYGIGGGGEPAAEEPAAEEPAAEQQPATAELTAPATPAPASTPSAEGDAEAEMEAMAVEAPVAEENAATEESEAPMALEVPAPSEEAAGTTAEAAAEAPMRSMADEAAKTVDGETVEVAPSPEEIPVPGQAEARPVPTARRPVPPAITIGLGIATVVLTAVTIWLGRRQAG